MSYRESLAYKLRMLGKLIPKRWKDEAIKEIKPFQEPKFIAEKIVNKGTYKGRLVKKEIQERLSSLLEKGAFDYKLNQIDSSLASKIEKYMEGLIRYKIRKGELDPQKAKVEYKKFMSSRK